MMNTPKDRLPKSRMGSSSKSRAAFKSPYGKDSAKTNQDQNKPKDERVELRKLMEKEQAVNTEIKDLKKQGFNTLELHEHINKLHEYNEIKDMGQMLIGQLAIQQGVTSKDLYERFGLDLDD